MILTRAGHLVWYRTVAPNSPFDLQVQSYRGQPVLTWWHGGSASTAADVIMDRHYHTVAVVRAAHGYWTDPHDFLITPQGTAWLVAQAPAKANLTRVGGPRDGTGADSIIQEVDIASGKLLWQWKAYGHIPLDASHERAGKGTYDFFHLNSLQLLPNGNLLISSRNTWSVYEISTRTKRVRWTLGGKYNQFKMGPRTRFEWQHDARLNGSTLTLFDDAASPQEEAQSSAKVMHLNLAARSVTLVRRYTHDPPLLSPAQGSAQLLPSGDVFVGWGSVPDFSEYSASGRQIFTGSFALGTTSYRALRFHWSGRPSTRPAMAVAAGSGGAAHVWASWNGANNVTSWRVLGGFSPGTLHPLATKRHLNFETEITLSHRPRYVQVQALGGHGQTLRGSAVHHLSRARS
jgi:hypothetical protein